MISSTFSVPLPITFLPSSILTGGVASVIRYRGGEACGTGGTAAAARPPGDGEADSRQSLDPHHVASSSAAGRRPYAVKHSSIAAAEAIHDGKLTVPGLLATRLRPRACPPVRGTAPCSCWPCALP